MIISIKNTEKEVEEIKRKYTPDFIYKFGKEEWRFTANDGDFQVLIKSSKGALIMAIEETDYDFFSSDGVVFGVTHDVQPPSTRDIADFFGWKGVDGI